MMLEVFNFFFFTIFSGVLTEAVASNWPEGAASGPWRRLNAFLRYLLKVFDNSCVAAVQYPSLECLKEKEDKKLSSYGIVTTKWNLGKLSRLWKQYLS